MHGGLILICKLHPYLKITTAAKVFILIINILFIFLTILYIYTTYFDHINLKYHLNSFQIPQ